MRQRSMITNSEDSSLLHINQQNVSNYIIYALEQEAALHAFFRIVESWLFRPFFLLNYRQRLVYAALRAFARNERHTLLCVPGMHHY